MEARGSGSPWPGRRHFRPLPTLAVANRLPVEGAGGGSSTPDWLGQSWWWVSQWRHPAPKGAGHGLSGGGHGCVAVQYFNEVIASNLSKTMTMSSWDTWLLPLGAASCQRQRPVLARPTGSSWSQEGLPSSLQLRGASPVVEEAQPSENLP